MGLKHAGLPFIVLKGGSAVSLRTSTIAASSASRFLGCCFFFFGSNLTTQPERRADSQESKDSLLLNCSTAKLLCRLQVDSAAAKFHRRRPGHDDVLSIALLA